MSTFDDREDVFEKKFAHDAEMSFKAEARACKHFGLWLGKEMGMSESDAESYAKEVVGANLDEPGFEDVKRFVMPAIEVKGLPITEHMLDTKLEAFFSQAKIEIVEEAA